MNTLELQSLLAPCALVRHFYYSEEVDSTMNQARRLVASAAGAQGLHGTLIVADAQTNGRGRHGRAWDAPPGSSLLCTMILSRKELPHSGDVPQLALLAAALPVAVCRGINTLIPDARIKYPNDIVCGERKLGGVLLETANDAVLAGFGVNCSQEMSQFPTNLKMPATSIFLETGKQPSRPALIVAIASALEEMLNPMEFLCAGEAMRELCETLGRTVVVDVGEDEVLQGVADTITPDGLLILKTDAGTRKIFTSQVLRTWSLDAEALS